MASQPSTTRTTSSRDRLLHAAKRLFARHGYEQTATSAIARAAGTSESQLMRYFGGKVGLLDALFTDAWADLNGRLRKVASVPAPTPQVLLDVLQTVTAAFTKDSDFATLFLFEGRRLRGEHPRIRLSEGFVAFADLTRGLVRKGQAEKEFDSSLDAGAMTSALLGASEGMIRDRVVARVAGGRAFAEREIRRTLEAVLAGFAGRSKTARTTKGAKSARAR
jgi:AcrR family transcriptional regulator